MIDRLLLVKDCQRQVRRLEADIRARALSEAALKARLEAEHAQLQKAGRTAAGFGSWLDEQVTQAAVSWVLACVFVRFLEDNALVDGPWLAGPVKAVDGQNRLALALQNREHYFSQQPKDSDRNYLEHVFRTIGRIPACKDLFAEDRNPLWKLPVSGDGAGELLKFWQERTADTGELAREFVAADGQVADTRFLGDLYEELSEAAQKRYALHQTPEFVEEFILDYTLDPAIETFGLKDVRMIDPTCGSGHFLLGAFRRLLGRWEKEAPPGTPRVELVKRALASVHGVDINPFAVAIARMRLLIAAMVACERRRLGDVPAFALNLAVGDSLLHGHAAGALQQELHVGEESFLTPDFLTPGEYAEARRILGQRYDAVVGNPPYIAVRDAALRERIKERYRACYKLWTLSVPFSERFFELARDGHKGRASGFVGLINSNNCTKREFGKKLIESVLPRLDLTHVIDTSDAHIPGHGTPTVILFGCNRLPSPGSRVRAVQGIRGESQVPHVPASGKVWCSIVENLGKGCVNTPWVSIVDLDRRLFATHPWSLGGGGLGDLKQLVEDGSGRRLGTLTASIGFVCITKQDEAFSHPAHFLRRCKMEAAFVRPFGSGESVRDWSEDGVEVVIFPYDRAIQTASIRDAPILLSVLWPYRRVLESRVIFGGQSYKATSKPWYEYGQIPVDRMKTQKSIVFGEIATHNHFVLDRIGKVFDRTAPVIKFDGGASEDDHLHVLALLNSSTICFWLKQVCIDKGVGGIGGGIGDEPWEPRFVFNSTRVAEAPILSKNRHDVVRIARMLDDTATRLAYLSPGLIATREVPSGAMLGTALADAQRLHSRKIAL